MIIDNIITFGGAIFLVVIMVKSIKVVKAIKKSRERIEKAFLHYPKK